MLEYRINKNVLKSDKFKFELVDDTEITGLIEPVTEEYADKLIMRCDCVTIDDLREGSLVEVVTELNMNYGDEFNLSNHYNFTDIFKVDSINKENNVFSIVIDEFINVDVDYYLLSATYNYFEECQEKQLREKQKYIDCEDNEKVAAIAGVYNVKAYGGDEFLYVYCKSRHFFDTVSNPCTLYFEFYDRDEYVWVYLKKDEKYIDEYGEEKIAPNDGAYYVTNENKNGFSVVPMDFEYVSPEILRAKIYDENGVFTNYNVERVYKAITNELIQSLNYPIYPSYVRVKRKTFLFGDKTTFDIYYEKPMTHIDIPLIQAFDTNMYQSDLLKEKYVKVEKEKAINKVIDLEKQIFHPVFCNGSNIDSIYKISFNFHFRKHRGENWVCKQDDFWNGVYVDANEVKFMDNFFSFNKKEEQSDLLTYLGFNNNDVRYQKNKLKKSFIRLMFYDSPNPTNQNLISYSTIYLDTNNLFTKFVKNMKKGEYKVIKENVDDTNAFDVISGLNGIRVDRETVEENNEDMRLSCQITVNDRNNNKTSCDGFYFYAWKNDEIGTEEQKAYLKIEFNHAGYGRTIPMMMPYWDKKKHSRKIGIKTFQEILNDWNNDKNENVSDGKYGLNQYNKFSYIKVKYRYSNKLRKYIYYLDEEVYGNISETDNYKDNELIINLFEAKVEV